MMITEVRLRRAPVKGAVTPTVQPLIRKNRTVSPLVVGIVAVVLLILGYAAIVITVARIVGAAASSG